MHYEPLFKLNLQHDYYSDGRCPDFTIVPTPECAQLLKNHRLVPKADVAGMAVYRPVRQGQSLITLAPQTTFRFYLRSPQPGFHTITDLEQTITSPGVALYSPHFAPYYRDVFALSEGKPTADEAQVSFQLSQLPRAGIRTEDFVIPDGSAQIVAYRPATRTVVIDPMEQQEGEVNLEYPLGLPQDIFARVDCTYTEMGQTFTIDFIAWAVPWTYWLIPADAGADLTVVLLEPDVVLTSGTSIGLETTAPSTVSGDHFPNAIREALNGDLSRCIALVSRKPVPYRKKYKSLPRVRATIGEEQSSEFLLAPPSLGGRGESFIRVGQRTPAML